MYNDDQSRRKEYKDGSNNYLSCGIRWGIWCGATERVSERVSPTDARTDFWMSNSNGLWLILTGDVRENINTGVVRLRQECRRMEGQKQRNAEMRQKYPELYQ